MNKVEIFCACLIVSFSLIGCTKDSKTEDKTHKANRKAMNLFRVTEVEGCEYILFYGSNEELRFDGVTHKGNCKNHKP